MDIRLLITGPAWSARPDSIVDAGRQPLAVERVISEHAARLVPGVITTTPHARYLAVHTRLAHEAQRRGWSHDDRQQFRVLLRRCEALFAAIAVCHNDAHPAEHAARAGTSQPHGAQAMAGLLRKPSFSVTDLARVYSEQLAGFLGTYGGIETLLGLTDGGPVPRPAVGDDVEGLAGLDDLIAMADRSQDDVLTRADLADLEHLCLCRVADAPDGVLLRRAYFAVGQHAKTHRLSAALLSLALRRERDAQSIDDAMDLLCCFTSDLRQVCHGDDLYRHALTWRGVLLRNWSVWAWRMFWARLVAPLDQPDTLDSAVASFVEGLPHTTVRQALRLDLPDLVDPVGNLLPAEHEVLAQRPGSERLWDPLTIVRMLAVGAHRLDHLGGGSLASFSDDRDAEDLGPRYVAAWLARNADRRLADAVAQQAHAAFGRADAVSRRKLHWTQRGLKMPTRLRREGDRWRVEGEEGYGPMSLRLNTFRSVLHQLGVLAPDGDHWTIGRHHAEITA